MHKTETPVLVCFAVREETRFFTPPTQPLTHVLITGMGVRRTEQALATHLSSKQPRLILTCGFAGGLNAGHPLGRVLFDATHGEAFQEHLLNSGALPGRFVHSDRVLVTASEKARLFQATGADAVEMESSVIVNAGCKRGIPVIVLRVISDIAGEDLPMDFNRYARAEGGLNMSKLLLGIAGSPSTLPKLMQFQGRLKQAARCLGATLEGFLSSSNLF